MLVKTQNTQTAIRNSKITIIPFLALDSPAGTTEIVRILIRTFELQMSTKVKLGSEIN